MRPWVYELMLEWAAADPVDDIERNRNEAIYGIQGNRNPYVDIPELADYVWGSRNEEVFYVDPSSTAPEVFVPVHDVSLDFGLQALSLGMNRQVMVRGRNLPTGLTATIEGNGFAMADADLTAQEVIAGAPLTITSSATAGGVYDAMLILRGEGNYEQRTPLRMTVIDGVPAYPARDITSTVNSRSFLATWMDMHLPEGERYIIDVYTKDSEGERKSFGTYPVELTDTFCFVRNPAASTTYYYEVRTFSTLIIAAGVKLSACDVFLNKNRTLPEIFYKVVGSSVDFFKRRIADIDDEGIFFIPDTAVLPSAASFLYRVAAEVSYKYLFGLRFGFIRPAHGFVRVFVVCTEVHNILYVL